MRAARSSDMTRYAILEDMNGRHGHSAEWWRTYYLIFADDIDRLVQADVEGPDSDDRPLATRRTKPLNGGGTLKPVIFSTVASSSSSSRKRKERPASPSPSEVSDTVEAMSVPTSHRSSRSARKVARPVKRQDDRASDSDEPRGGAAKASEPHYKLTIPSSLPEHAPSVPTNLVPGGKGYLFTEEDFAYFVDTVLWQAKTEPNPGRQTILAALSAQATHHTWGSWKSFWRRANGPEVLREGLRMVAATVVAKQE
ncbi:hypothetical protein PENSPDRAFT_757891 [Peniophora sp. CONT]|nr:hypothetical protein PENSPDRAFT_757891 [Peniophora sp. CONT]